MNRRRISEIALAAVAALALTAELATAEHRRVGQYLSWQQMGNSPGLNDLPSPPKSSAQTPAPANQLPGRANDRLRAAGPVDRSPTPAAWHEAVLTGDVVAARKSVPHKAPKTVTVLKAK